MRMQNQSSVDIISTRLSLMSLFSSDPCCDRCATQTLSHTLKRYSFFQRQIALLVEVGKKRRFWEGFKVKQNGISSLSWQKGLEKKRGRMSFFWLPSLQSFPTENNIFCLHTTGAVGSGVWMKHAMHGSMLHSIMQISNGNYINHLGVKRAKKTDES